MITQYKKYLLVASLFFCIRIHSIPEMGATVNVVLQLAPETRKILENLGTTLDKFPTKFTHTIQPAFPTASKNGILTFLGLMGAISGIMLMHTGINLLTEPLKTPGYIKQNDQTSAVNESLADLQTRQANSHKWGLARCTAGLVMLTCSAVTIYNFGH